MIARRRAAANRKHFTDQNVLRLPHRSHQFLTWDEGTDAARGLAILSSPTGTKSYRVVYYYPGSSKPHYKNLGRVGEISLSDARSAARNARATAKKGEDPRADAAARSDSFGVALENYIQHEQIGRFENTSANKTKKVMENHCRAWLKRPVATIRSQEIDALLELLRDGNADKALKARPYLANRLYAHLKDFFRWCVSKKMLAASPMSDIEKPWGKAKRRTRDWFKGTAADKAIAALWRAADEIGGHDGRYLKMMLLTGKRKSALAAMRWDEIDASWFWFAPPSVSKTKLLHPIPLPKKAEQVLHPKGETGPVFGALNLTRLQHKIRAASGLNDFFYHGARHLLESKMAELRIKPHIRDLLFDHAPKRGSGATYDHHDYHDEMRAALNQWAAHIETLVQPAEGVTRLR